MTSVEVLLCEDIRVEVDGKHTLVGLLTGDILVRSFPTVIRFAFFIQLKPPLKSRYHVKLNINAGQTSAESETDFQIEDVTQPAQMVVPTIISHFQEEGKIRLALQFDDGTELYFEKPVSANPNQIARLRKSMAARMA